MAATTINTTALLSHNRVVSKKVVLVTGGATGLGRAVSLLFGKAGAKVVIGDSDEPAGLAVVAEIEKNGGTATFRKTNFASWDEQLGLFAHAVATYGHIDIVLPLDSSNPAHEEDWFSSDETHLAAPAEPDLTPIDVGISGLLYTSKLAFHYLLRSSSSHKSVVFLSLTAPPGSGITFPPYASAARHAALGLLRSFKTTVSGGVRVKVVAPSIPAKGEKPPSEDLIAQTFFYAATDPSSSTHGDLITVAATTSLATTTASTASAGALPVTPLQLVELKTVGMYRDLQNRFWWILLVNSILKQLLVRIAYIMGH